MALRPLLRNRAGFLSVNLDAGEVVRAGVRDDLRDESVHRLRSV
jgi:hypothetical protein